MTARGCSSERRSARAGEEPRGVRLPEASPETERGSQEASGSFFSVRRTGNRPPVARESHGPSKSSFRRLHFGLHDPREAYGSPEQVREPRLGARAARWTLLTGQPILNVVTPSMPTHDEIGAAVQRVLSADAGLAGPVTSSPDARREIHAVYLFGSFGRGEAGPHSDVDLGLLYRTPPATTLLGQPFELEADLAELLGRSVQCVVMNAAPPDLLHRILRDGVLLLDRDPSRRIRFEVNARNQYFDVKRMLDQYRNAGRVA